MNFRIIQKTVLIFFLFAFRLDCQIIVNEIQPAPIGNEPEWVEIFNPFDNDFSCKNCLLNDATNNIVSIPDFNLKSKRFALLTKDSFALKSKRQIPEDCLIIQFPKMPTMNNISDIVVLRKSDSTIIDSIYYDMKWGKAGISLERIDYLKPAISRDNWAASCSSDSATAGYENCNAQKDYSAKISLLKDKSSNLTFNIINNGRKNLSGLNFEILADINRNNNFSPSEIIHQGTIISIPKDNYYDLLTLYNNLADILPRYGKFNCVLCLLMNSKKDTLLKYYFDFYHSYPLNSLMFNEIMFDVSKDNSEYLEFYNTTSDTINLNQWFIANKQNRTKSDTFRIINDLFIEPKGLFLVAFDTLIYNKFPELKVEKNVFAKKSSFNLLAAGDKLIIADPNGFIMDSVNYAPSMHLSSLTIKKDVSLEKKNVNLKSYEFPNWTSSRDTKGGTPAQPNSIYETTNKEGFLTAKPNPFSPYSTGNDTKTEIHYELPFRDALISVKIFDTNGLMVVEPVNNRISASYGSIFWDGKSKNESYLPPGQYIVMFQASDTETNKIWESKIVVVIGK